MILHLRHHREVLINLRIYGAPLKMVFLLHYTTKQSKETTNVWFVLGTINGYGTLFPNHF